MPRLFSLPVLYFTFIFCLLDNPISNQSATSATDKVITPKPQKKLRWVLRKGNNVQLSGSTFLLIAPFYTLAKRVYGRL